MKFTIRKWRKIAEKFITNVQQITYPWEMANWDSICCLSGVEFEYIYQVLFVIYLG